MLYLLHSNLVYDTITIIQIAILQIITILFISFNVTLFQAIFIKYNIIFFKSMEVLYYN